jgi:hypothetical protein
VDDAFGRIATRVGNVESGEGLPEPNGKKSEEREEDG